MFTRIIFLFLSFFAVSLNAQITDTISLNLESAEKLLLENNLSLLAEELNLEKAEAEKIQAKVWPNPSLSIEQLNPYVSNYQKKHAEEQASLFGSKDFGRYRQVEIQLERVFNLAGKRKKQKAIAEVSADQATAYLADFLWDLKTEFRKDFIDFSYQKRFLELLKQQLSSLDVLVKSHEKQYEQKNINKLELTRLKISLLQLKNEIIDAQNNLDELQSQLIILLNLPNNSTLNLQDNFTFDLPTIDLNLEYLQEKALQNRSDIQVSQLNTELAKKEYSLEKSERTPDLGVSLNYDRGGGIYPDYVGLGLAIDLPFSNPNKGNIKKAKINIEQQEFFHEEHLLKVKLDIRRKYERLLYLQDYLKDIDADYLEELDLMMEAYTSYFQNKNINITTYMDFLESYMEGKESIFNNHKEYLQAREDLKYATGLELLSL